MSNRTLACDSPVLISLLLKNGSNISTNPDAAALLMYFTKSLNILNSVFPGHTVDFLSPSPHKYKFEVNQKAEFHKHTGNTDFYQHAENIANDTEGNKCYQNQKYLEFLIFISKKKKSILESDINKMKLETVSKVGLVLSFKIL